VTNNAQIWLVVGIIAAAFLLFACVMTIACLGIIGTSEEKGVPDKPSAEAPVAPDVEPPTPETPEPSGGVTLANFNRVEAGMTYAEVAEIFGRPGDLSVETKLAGAKVEVYSWRWPGGE
jgi:hypothetical protein